MREDRVANEIITDDVLILTLYALVQERTQRPSVGDRLKAMKLVYLANQRMFAERAKGLNCTFFRWTWGPMSNDVYGAWEQLRLAGLVEEEEELVVTPEGHALATAFIAEVLEIEENHYFLKVLETVADQWGNKSRSEIMDAVYKMKVTPLGAWIETTVEEAPLTSHFTEALEPADTKRSLNVPEAWLETLALQLNPDALAGLRRSEDDARNGRIINGNTLWAEFESPSL